MPSGTMNKSMWVHNGEQFRGGCVNSQKDGGGQLTCHKKLAENCKLVLTVRKDPEG